MVFADLTNRVVAEETVDPLKVQRELAEAWASLLPQFPRDNIHVERSIEHTVQIIRCLHGVENGAERKPVDVLVAGSLHLVGGVIEVAGLSDVAL